MEYYLSKQGETIDLICWQYYGFQKGAVEKVLAANPIFRLLDEVLPIGTVVRLPRIEQPQEDKTIRLWDYGN